MKIKLNFLNLLIALAVTAGSFGMISSEVAANGTAQSLPFSQNWSNTGLITTDDNWSNVLGIMGYRGDGLIGSTGTDPQTILQPDNPGVVDVNANQTDPNQFSTGGVTEFELTDPVIALAGSNTAEAPYLLIAINTTGKTDIQVSYDLRDLETGADNAVQQVALHYRVGNSGDFTNIPEAYVVDATIGNGVKTTHVSVTLPSACNNAALVQLRIMTTNAAGNDEWVGIDNISISFNVAPVAKDIELSTPEDTTLDITLDVSDANDDPLTPEIVTEPLHGTYEIGGLVVTYTPDADYNGMDSFTYKVSDGKLESNTSTVSITVTPVNDAPVANDITKTTAEDTAKAITLNVSDIDGDTLTAEILSSPTHGQVSLNGLVVTYTPNADYNGSDSFTYRVSDGELWSNTARIDITIAPVNDAPVANDVTETTAEDTAKTITLDANDIDGDALTADILSNPTHGEVSVSGLGVTYTPDADYNGPDSFTYKVSDGELESDAATVNITVTPVNDAPMANDMTETTAEDTAKVITLTVSDSDGDTLTAEILSNPTHGEVSVSGLVVTYTPDADYNGSDNFTFKVNDGMIDSNTATVSITVTSVNDAPVANDMTETTAEDTAKVITLNVSDIDGDTLTADILSNPTHGEVSVSGLSVTYTPDADYNGPDSFTYKVSDGELESDTATVNITVTPVNDAPVASDMTETTAEDTAKAITLNVSDIDGDTLTAEILSNPTHGEVSVSGIVVTYTPDANYNGPDSFTYKVSDGELWSDTAIVSITVTPVNDAPVAESFEVELQENGSKTFTLLASDVDGDTLTFSLVSGTAHGTLNCAGVNCTYTPNPHWFGMDSFIFKANDGLLESNEATVTLNVIPLPRIYLPIIFR